MIEDFDVNGEAEHFFHGAQTPFLQSDSAFTFSAVDSPVGLIVLVISDGSSLAGSWYHRQKKETSDDC
jgi:hypothetical protein